MTKEKASVIIGNIHVYGDECYSIAEYQEAKTMAVQALLQEKNTGHWVGIDEYPYEDWECNRCGETLFANVHIPDDYNFCPFCGAKMEKLTESEYDETIHMTPRAMKYLKKTIEKSEEQA